MSNGKSKSVLPSTAGEKPRRRRLPPDERREELLRAGKNALRRNGDAARVEDVTAGAGASKGTFYVYFASWADFLNRIRDQEDEFVVRRFVELSAPYRDWRSVLEAFPRLQLQLVRELEGLEIVYQLAAKSDARDPNMERTVEFIVEAHRAGAIEAKYPEMIARLLYRMVINTTDAILRGEEEEEACAICGEFIVSALNAKRVPRTDWFAKEV